MTKSNPSTVGTSSDQSATRDRRVERTKSLLHQALIELVRDRDYDRITVQDILDRADVGRSTFYAHFRNKDHLLLGDFGGGGFGPTNDSEADQDVLFPGRIDLFAHLAENYDLYRALAGTEALPTLMDRLERSFLERWRARIGRTASAESGEAAARFLAGATMNTIKWWLAAGMPQPAEAMNRLIDQLAAACLASLENGPEGPLNQPAEAQTHGIQ